MPPVDRITVGAVGARAGAARAASVILDPTGVRIASGFQRGSNGTWLPAISVEQPDLPPIVFTAGRCHASVSARLALECAKEMAHDWRALVYGDPFIVCKWLSGR